MASSTIGYDLTKGAWTQIATGGGSFLVQLAGPTPALIHVADSLPAIDVDDYVVLRKDGDPSIGLSGLAAGTKVYARAGIGTNEGTRVTVAFGG